MFTEDAICKICDEIEWLETVNTKAFLYGKAQTAELSNRKWLEVAHLLKAIKQNPKSILFFPKELEIE
jgi:hypothetical protein